MSETKEIIVGKIYKVVEGRYMDFVGECVSYNPQKDLPIILEDFEFNARACYEYEIKETLKQIDERWTTTQDAIRRSKFPENQN